MTDLSLWFDESPALQLLNTAQAHSLAHYTQVVKADQQLLTAWPYDMSITIGASAIVSTHFYSPSSHDDSLIQSLFLSRKPFDTLSIKEDKKIVFEQCYSVTIKIQNYLCPKTQSALYTRITWIQKERPLLQCTCWGLTQK
jgi:hypothetical protein